MANYLSRVNVQKRLRESGFFLIDMSDDDIIRQVDAEYKGEVFLKSIFCVNCWNKKSIRVGRIVENLCRFQ